MHQFVWLSERGGQLFKFASDRGLPRKGGSSLRKEGVPDLEETIFTILVFNKIFNLAISLKVFVLRFSNALSYENLLIVFRIRSAFALS